MNRKNISWILYFSFFAIVLSVILLTTIIVSASDYIEPTTLIATISEVYIPSEASSDEEVMTLEVVKVERVEPTTPQEANEMLDETKQRNVDAVTVYNGLRSLGYTEEHPAVQLALTEINNTTEDYKYYIDIQTEISKSWNEKAQEYPIATQVWLYMKDEFGWNDIVCAGIMGNMMAECGGCWTADLDWEVDTKHGLGMVQWIGSRKKLLTETYGKKPTVEQQLLFMRDELYGTNGIERQVTDEQFNEIMNASTPEECAYAFATHFERCAKQYRSKRKEYANIAYNYFVD